MSKLKGDWAFSSTFRDSLLRGVVVLQLCALGRWTNVKVRIYQTATQTLRTTSLSLAGLYSHPLHARHKVNTGTFKPHWLYLRFSRSRCASPLLLRLVSIGEKGENSVPFGRLRLRSPLELMLDVGLKKKADLLSIAYK